MKKTKKSSNCPGLKKNIIKGPVFKSELALCRKLAKKNRNKCCWGKCRDCGVIPLLYKLHKGVLLEGASRIKRIKTQVLH